MSLRLAHGGSTTDDAWMAAARSNHTVKVLKAHLDLLRTRETATGVSVEEQIEAALRAWAVGPALKDSLQRPLVRKRVFPKFGVRTTSRTNRRADARGGPPYHRIELQISSQLVATLSSAIHARVGTRTPWRKYLSRAIAEALEPYLSQPLEAQKGTGRGGTDGTGPRRTTSSGRIIRKGKR